MTESELIEKIYQKRREIEQINEYRKATIKQLDDKEFETSKSVKNLLKRLSLQKCRFKRYVDVIYKGRPAKIFGRNIDENSFDLSYSVSLKDGTIVRNIREDDYDLDDVDLSRTRLREDIISELYDLMDRFNPSTNKWKSKEDWKYYKEWIKGYDKNIHAVVEITITSTGRKSISCFRLNRFFEHIDEDRSIIIKDILLESTNCRSCKYNTVCHYGQYRCHLE